VNSPEDPSVAEDDDEAGNDEGDDKEKTLRRSSILVRQNGTGLEDGVIAETT
jgi:hypothetical protein